MPLPHWLARFNRQVTNPLMRTVAGHVGPLVEIEHVGRRTGTRHRTPVVAFWDDGIWIVPLTYGAGTDWQRNLEAAGRGVLVASGTRFRVGDPRVVRRTTMDAIPVWADAACAAIGADDALLLDAL